MFIKYTWNSYVFHTSEIQINFTDVDVAFMSKCPYTYIYNSSVAHSYHFYHVSSPKKKIFAQIVIHI